jgi:outer membrane biosynthesis protein TonB
VTLDRIDSSAFAVAVAGHLALLALLKLARDDPPVPPPIPDAMEVSFVEDVALQSSAPAAAPSAVYELPTEPPTPVEAPIPEPAPRSIADPAPARPRPAPQRRSEPAPRQTPPPAQRWERRPLTPEGLGIPGAERASNPPGRPAAATISAQDLSSIRAAIARQIQPCANRQPNPGLGANRITVTLNLRLRPDGSFASAPSLVPGRTTGVDSENGRYVERVGDLIVAAARACSPFRGLPSQFYQTAQGGWRNININYRLP